MQYSQVLYARCCSRWLRCCQHQLGKVLTSGFHSGPVLATAGEPRKTSAPTSTPAPARGALPFPPTDTGCISPATGLEGLAATIFMFLDATTSATTSLGNPRRISEAESTQRQTRAAQHSSRMTKPGSLPCTLTRAGRAG